MSNIQGLYFDGTSSRGVPASISIEGKTTLYLSAGDIRNYIPLHKINISSRLGNTPRIFVFDNGAKFETSDNDAVDTALKAAQIEHHHFIHQLESKLKYIVPAVVIVLLSMWAFAQHGIPATAKFLAYNLPSKTSEFLNAKTLEIMDAQYFQPSQLNDMRQSELQAAFEKIYSQATLPANYQLLFRSSEEIGANAFALPSGTILITDQLVALAQNDNEIYSILAHEVGHVEYKHGLRQAIQGSLLSFLILWITGDVSGASTFITTLPAVLISLQYSREFEDEADDYAMQYMQNNAIGLQHFICIMQRLEQAHRPKKITVEQATTETEDKQTTAKQENDDNASHFLEFLSTHPDTDKRIEKFKQQLGTTVDCQPPD